MRNILEPLPQDSEATVLRRHLSTFLQQAAAGALRLHLPGLDGPMAARGDGHFHLACELFFQVEGYTLFRFPHAQLLVRPGEALIVPPTLRHDEEVRGGDKGEPFRNVVVYAEGAALSCHLAHEIDASRPGIAHLESRQHPQVRRIQHWLLDAARLGAGNADGGAADALAVMQSHALIAAATAGVMRVLDDAARPGPTESPLVARVRTLVQNQLGDPQLSVTGLARECGCSADHLSSTFSRSTGEHLAGYVNRLRVERAARLLADTHLSGKEVAWACGFASPSYFVRTFRAHHGVTPGAWREASAGRGRRGQPHGPRHEPAS